MVALMAAVGCSSHRQPSPMEAEARQAGTEAAQQLMQIDRTDTLSMQRSILDAKCVQSKYALARDSDAVRAFDDGFATTLKEGDASLYREIFPDRTDKE